MAPKKDTAAERDECVAYAVESLWGNVEEHMRDKFIFPKIVSYAVARTLAAMVHMVSVSMVQRMDNWDSDVEGRVAEEWLEPKEMVLPPLDTWARGVVHVKKPQLPTLPPPTTPRISIAPAATPSPRTSVAPTPATGPATLATIAEGAPATTAPPPPPQAPAVESFRPRRSTITGLQTAREVYERKGSPGRRFSEGQVLPPEVIQRLKPIEPPADLGRKKSVRKSVKPVDGRKSQIGRKSEMSPRKPSQAKPDPAARRSTKGAAVAAAAAAASSKDKRPSTRRTSAK